MKKIKQHKGFTIKQISERDDKDIYTYKYYIFNKSGDIEWECDSYQECIDWIEGYEK